MWAYIVRRLLLVPLTLLGILSVNFLIIQFAPGAPVEQTIAQFKGIDVDAQSRITGDTGSETAGSQGVDKSGASGNGSQYRGARGLDPELIKVLEKQFGFDKPAHVRFFMMLRDYSLFRFGDSFYRDKNVLELIKEKLPVSISLGV